MSTLGLNITIFGIGIGIVIFLALIASSLHEIEKELKRRREK